LRRSLDPEIAEQVIKSKHERKKSLAAARAHFHEQVRFSRFTNK
jgi:hypothetical protein